MLLKENRIVLGEASHYLSVRFLQHLLRYAPELVRNGRRDELQYKRLIKFSRPNDTLYVIKWHGRAYLVKDRG
jgi:hypothetical protein